MMKRDSYSWIAYLTIENSLIQIPANDFKQILQSLLAVDEQQNTLFCKSI